MPNINFPSNPISGQTYVFNDTTWTYNGVAWVAKGTGPQGSTGPAGPLVGLQSILDIGNTFSGSIDVEGLIGQIKNQTDVNLVPSLSIGFISDLGWTSSVLSLSNTTDGLLSIVGVVHTDGNEGIFNFAQNTNNGEFFAMLVATAGVGFSNEISECLLIGRDQNVYLYGYTSSRDDYSSFTASNFLYTDNTGKLLSASISSLGGIGSQGPQGPTGAGGSITGTPTYISKFNGTGDGIMDSNITDDGSIIAANLLITARAGLNYPVDQAPVGEIVYFGSGSLASDALCCYSNGGSWGIADATDINKSKYLLGISLGTDPSVDGMIVRGVVFSNDVTSMTAGDVLYLNTTGGSAPWVTNVAPSGPGEVVRIVGYVIDPAGKIFYFCPDNSYIEIV